MPITITPRALARRHQMLAAFARLPAAVLPAGAVERPRFVTSAVGLAAHWPALGLAIAVADPAPPVTEILHDRTRDEVDLLLLRWCAGARIALELCVRTSATSVEPPVAVTAALGDDGALWLLTDHGFGFELTETGVRTRLRQTPFVASAALQAGAARADALFARLLGECTE